MPPQAYEGSPNAQDGGRNSVTVNDITLPYTAQTVKAVHFNTAGTMTGFKLWDDDSGTARTFTGQQGGYVLGPFKQVTTAPADAILEYDDPNQDQG